MKLIFLLVVTCGCALSNETKDKYRALIEKFDKEDAYRAQRVQENDEEMIENAVRRVAYNTFMVWRELTSLVRSGMVFEENWASNASPDLIDLEQTTYFLKLMHVANTQLLFTNASYRIVEANLSLLQKSKRSLHASVQTNIAAVEGTGDAKKSALSTLIRSSAEDNSTTIDVIVYEMMRCDKENMEKILEMYIVEIDEFEANANLLNQIDMPVQKFLFASKIGTVAASLCGIGKTLKEIINMRINIGNIEKLLPYQYLMVQLEKAYDFMKIFNTFAVLTKSLRSMGLTETAQLQMPNEKNVQNAISAIEKSLDYLKSIRGNILEEIESDFENVQTRLKSSNSFKPLKCCRVSLKVLLSEILESFPPHHIWTDQIKSSKVELFTYLERGAL